MLTSTIVRRDRFPPIPVAKLYRQIGARSNAESAMFVRTIINISCSNRKRVGRGTCRYQQKQNHCLSLCSSYRHGEKTCRTNFFKQLDKDITYIDSLQPRCLSSSKYNINVTE